MEERKSSGESEVEKLYLAITRQRWQSGSGGSGGSYDEGMGPDSFWWELLAGLLSIAARRA